MNFFVTAFNVSGYIVAIVYDKPQGFILKAIGGILAMIYFWHDGWIFSLTLFYFLTDCVMIHKKRKQIFKAFKL